MCCCGAVGGGGYQAVMGAARVSMVRALWVGAEGVAVAARGAAGEGAVRAVRRAWGCAGHVIKHAVSVRCSPVAEAGLQARQAGLQIQGATRWPGAGSRHAFQSPDTRL